MVPRVAWKTIRSEAKGYHTECSYIGIETEVAFRLESVSNLGAIHPDWQHIRCLLYICM